MSSGAPMFPSPVTQFAAFLNPTSTYHYPPGSLCKRIEKKLIDCYEAYGKGKKGAEKCHDLIYDFHECKYNTFQRYRYHAIRNERMKQYREGKIDKPFDENPPIDGLIYF